MIRAPRTLTTRLVLTCVALVAVAGLLVALTSTLALRGYLTQRLDDQVHDAVGRAANPRVGAGGSQGRPLGQGPGTLIAVFPQSSASPGTGVIVTATAELAQVSQKTLASLRTVPADNHSHTVRAAGERYRVQVDQAPGGRILVVGLPTKELDRTISNLRNLSLLLTLLGVALAALIGRWLVRRQLRPLYAVAATAREVATQELSTGDTAISTRVPVELTDPATEVGQVGASMNTMLDHVDAALSARHRSEQQVRQFVADASHELRTPLATIQGYAELSRRTPDDADTLSAAMSKVETEAGRMSHLVSDLLLLARLDSGRPLARDDVDLTRLLLEAVADARVLAPEHRWVLELADEPVVVTGDEQRLHQAITNLLNNARTHTPPGTTVTVRAITSGDGVHVEVHDNGPGLPADLDKSVFERFTRGDSSRTRASGGAGLGLSLVSAIGEAHGGRAEVSSLPGDTTFTLTLPKGAN